MMPGMTEVARPLGDEVLTRLTRLFDNARDPGCAAEQSAYMRNQFPFVGLSAPTQRALARSALTGLPEPTEDDLRAVGLACWDRAEREYQAFACDWLRTHVIVPGPGFLETLRALITTKSWWDTVDPLATRVVGGLVKRHPRLVTRMDAWSTEKNPWLVRTALLHQLHYGAETDTDRLFRYCTRQAGHPDFFIRKAIGWALRQYARTDPEAVRRYVSRHRGELSPLSVREASRGSARPAPRSRHSTPAP
jgi:3-methyladenine DNA glycosylase AlkD